MDREHLHPLQELFKLEYPGDETHPSVRRDERHDNIYEILHGKEAEDGNSCQRVEDRFDIENMIELEEAS